MDKTKKRTTVLNWGRETHLATPAIPGQNTWSANHGESTEDLVGLPKGRFQNFFLLAIELTVNGDLFLIAHPVSTIIDRVSSHAIIIAVNLLKIFGIPPTPWIVVLPSDWLALLCNLNIPCTATVQTFNHV
ncbi:hypothetical protein BJX63DRAFT_369559 [Aspergillus granulosus]|uniref:Uncharacterized protein n=1 Tax=Aspergillus granulosus TaxID=176169 RepID=A0ABR4H370_9EURO